MKQVTKESQNQNFERIKTRSKREMTKIIILKIRSIAAIVGHV